MINSDLLSEFEYFDVPYEPTPGMDEVLAPNIGYVGFDTCSIIPNLGSLFWFVCFYIVQVCVTLLFTDSVLQMIPRKIAQKIKQSRDETIWSGVLASLNDNLLVFVFGAVIRVMRKRELELPFDAVSEDVLVVIILGILPIMYVAIGYYLYKNFDAMSDPDSAPSRKFGGQLSGIIINVE